MTTTASTQCTETGVLAAMRYMAAQQARLENGADENTHTGQYRLGKADGYASAIQLLAETTGVAAGEYLHVDPLVAAARDLGCAWDSYSKAFEPAAFAMLSKLFEELAKAIPEPDELT